MHADVVMCDSIILSALAGLHVALLSKLLLVCCRLQGAHLSARVAQCASPSSCSLILMLGTVLACPTD